MKIILPILIFIIGTVFASFGNMLMYRLANNKPILKDSRSYCPNCKSEIKWYDNIPIISYIVLKGRCRNCKEKISLRYLITEIFGGVIFLGVYFFYVYYIQKNYEIAVIESLLISFILLALYITSYVDIKSLTAPIMMQIIMFVFALAKYLTYVISMKDYGLTYLLGLGIPVVILLLIYFFSVVVFKKEPIGLGDVIIFGILGLSYGVTGIFFILLFSSLICSIAELIRIKKTGERREIPFVPYIFIGALLTTFICPIIGNLFISF